MNTNVNHIINEPSYNKHQLYANIIIPLYLPQTYTWSVPKHLEQKIKEGIRVEVALRNKKYAGIVKEIHHNKPSLFEPKEILNLLDDEPIVHVQQLKLWQWMAQYYMCTEGEVMQAAIPANFKLSSETILIWNEEEAFNLHHTNQLSDEEFIVAEALEIKKELKLSQVQQILDANHVYPIIKKIIEKKICYVWEELTEKFKPKKQTYLLLHPQYNNEETLANLLNNWAKAPKQLELLLSYLHLIKTEGEVTQTTLLKKSNATPTQLKALIEKNILIAETRSVDRLPLLPKTINIDFTLSAAQQKALENIRQELAVKNICLLQGITASGKTQVYVKLIEQYLQTNQQVLFMLPEIALTAQLIRRIQKYFGGNIAVYHSKFNANERVEIWNKVKEGTINIILGARSALLLPFKKLGLIIVDEEHDNSYKQQEPAPRYHARDTAIYYASLFNAKVLLGSATPSVETYYNTQQKKYGLVTLTERYNNLPLPKITIVDIKKAAVNAQLQQQKNVVEKISLSPELINAIHASLQQKKQVIIFQNRRGYSPYLLCKTCGWIPHCNNCDVTLTYHKAKNNLTCHYCGSHYTAIKTCAACGSTDFVQKNFGTEKIEEQLIETFTDARIARMDYDTVKGKHTHENIIKQFEQQQIDILVGTQMIVKGLDFENVNLVGIVDADALLNFTDFRVNERAYQLMEQVSGRAGRKSNDGTVLIQVSNMHHPVLRFLQEHNYNNLYNFEIPTRKLYNYPPFSKLIKITCKHKEKHIAEEAATLLKNELGKTLAAFITGPAEPVINRIRNKYLWEILLKLPKNSTLLQQTKTLLWQQYNLLATHQRYKNVQVIFDVDII